ncbi:hypothetical protein D3C80_1420150 [compost metagenome]
MQDTLTGSSITKHTNRNAIVFVVIIGKCDTGTQTNLATYDTMTSEKSLFFGEEVH